MTKAKILTIIGLLLFCIVVFLPPIIHGYVYPNLGDDTGGTLALFDDMRDEEEGFPTIQYLGYLLVGYPLVVLSSMSGIDIDVLYLWFNYVALAGVGITLYFVVSKLLGRVAGWLALLLVLFGSQSILFQFYYGQTFNMINIGIIMPFLIYFIAKYLVEGKKYQFILGVLFLALYSSFHTSGVYLPAVAGLATLIYIITMLIRRRKIQKRVIILVSVMMVFGVGLFVWLVFLPTLDAMSRHNPNPLSIILAYIGKGMPIPIGSYFLSIVSPTVLILLSLAVVHYREIFKSVITKQIQIIGLLLLSAIVVLASVVFTRFSLDPWRQALDMATVFALFIAILTGVLLKHQKTKLIIVAVILCVGFGLYHSVPTWFGYNSAVRPADIEATAYIDNYQTFSASANVQPQIYDRFTTANYVGINGDVIIVRSEPMTPRSDPENIWYGGHGILPDDDYILSQIFKDEKVEVKIYEKKLWTKKE